MIDNKPSKMEILALFSANEAGEMIIPGGSATKVDAFINSLLTLESAGFASRNAGKKFYRPFVLTPKGKSLKAELLLRAFTANEKGESRFCGIPLKTLEK